MSAKDFFYIAALLLTAWYCYRRGFLTGVLRTRKLWKSLLEQTAPLEELPPAQTGPIPLSPEQRVCVRGPRAFFTQSTIRGAFGKN